MNRTTLFALTALMAGTSSFAAFAASDQDAAYDKRNGFIVDSRGGCVRTKWMESGDPCAPEAPAPRTIPAPAPVMPTVSLEQRTIYFNFDSAALTGEALAKLDTLAGIINSSKAIADVRIHGFTDQFGTSDYNKKLAASRASAVKSYLDSKSRLSTTIGDIKGVGKSAPEESCGALKQREAKIACMAKERRVEIEFKAER